MKINENRLINSFKYAIAGLTHAIKGEKNLQFHVVMTVITVLLAFIFDFSAYKWTILLLTIGIVISLELVNTAIEATVNLNTTDLHPLAKIAKDVAAAAVFFFSIIAVIIGLILFLPPLLEILI